METLIAMCCLYDVQILDISGLNLGSCRLIQPFSVFLVSSPDKKAGTFNKCALNLTGFEPWAIPHSLCVFMSK